MANPITILGYKPAEIRKALAGGVAAVAPLLIADITDGHLSRLEAGGLAAAFVAGALAVFGIKNATTPPPAE